MDLLFLTGIFPKEKETEILENSKGNVQNAANVLQWNLINGLDECLGKVSLLNAVFIGSYPKRYKKLFLEEKTSIKKLKSGQRIIRPIKY